MSTDNLAQALDLVRGRPFEGVPPRRYAWAEPVWQRMTALISDVAYELGSRRLTAGDWQGVEAGVVKGIQVAPALERLWRLRLLAAHQSGNEGMFHEAVARVEALSDALGVGLDPETTALLDMIQHESSFQELLAAVA